VVAARISVAFGERCPQVITNNKIDKSDYVVVLDHEGGKSFVLHKNKVAVFNRISGDSVVSESTLSLGGSVQDACEAITKDWSVATYCECQVKPTPWGSLDGWKHWLPGK